MQLDFDSRHSTKANGDAADGESSQTHEVVCQPTQLEVEKVFSHQDHSKQQLTFRNLPAELRNMIWYAALAPRVIIIRPQERNAETDSPTRVDFNKIPGMLFANRESRLIAQRHYDQRFFFTFYTRLPTVQPDGSNYRVMCQIPVIMSALDEIAYSRSHIRAQVQKYPSIRTAINTFVGAPQPQIKRLSILSDRLIRHGINAEQLARLLDPVAPEYLNYIISSGEMFTWSTFGKCSEPELSDWYPEGVESLCIGMSYPRGLIEWLRSGFRYFYLREVCTTGLRC